MQKKIGGNWVNYLNFFISGDALLYAITEGVYKIVEMLINHPTITTEMLANDWGKVSIIFNFLSYRFSISLSVCV